MSELCLSVAQTLRCQSLTRLESGILLLPTGLELFFCFGLVLAKLGLDRKPLLLASEGVLYFILALIDAVIHVVPRVALELNVFGPLDIIIGALSFAPLLLYTLFLLLYSTSELLATASYPTRSNTRLLLFIFIPVIVVLNELASFISISYRTIGGVVAVGFTNLLAHTLLDDLVLAFVIAFQAATLAIAFMRSVNAFRLRGSETVSDDNRVTTHMLNGLLWMVVGILLGTVESALGFIPNSFPAILVRRLLRLFGRACLIIGVINGVDRAEDFHIEPRPQRRSRLLNLVSNPRTSTFRQVGGYHFEPRAQNRGSFVRTPEIAERFGQRLSGVPRAYSPLRDPPVAGPSRYGGAPSSLSTQSARVSHTINTINTFTPDATSEGSGPQQRVTVHFTNDRTPVLMLRRFSDWSIEKAVTGMYSNGAQEAGPSTGHARAKSMPPDALFRQYRSAPSTSSAPTPPRPPPVPTMSSVCLSSFATFGTAGHGVPGSLHTTASASGSISSSVRHPEEAVIVNAVRAYQTRCRETLAPQGTSVHLDVVAPPIDRKHSDSTSDTLDAMRALVPQFPPIPSRSPTASSASADSGYAASRLQQAVQNCVAVQGEPGAGEEPEDDASVYSASRPPSTVPLSARSRRSTLRQEVLEENFRRSVQEQEACEPASPSSQALSRTMSQLVATPPPVPWPETSWPEESLPTPMSMDMRMPSRATLPARTPRSPPPRMDDGRPRKARTLSAKAIQAAAEEKAEADAEGVALGRITSVGSAPRRIRPTPSVTFARESVAAEIDLSAFVESKPQRTDSASMKRQSSRLKKKRRRQTATTVGSSVST